MPQVNHKRHWVEYGGCKWPSLMVACNDLRLNYWAVLKSGKSLKEYLEGSYLIDGVLFTSLEEVARGHNVPLSELTVLLGKGIGVELALKSLKDGIPLDPLLGTGDNKGQ